jgi:hypothetical protein
VSEQRRRFGDDLIRHLQVGAESARSCTE